MLISINGFEVELAPHHSAKVDEILASQFNDLLGDIIQSKIGTLNGNEKVCNLAASLVHVHDARKSLQLSQVDELRKRFKNALTIEAWHIDDGSLVNSIYPSDVREFFVSKLLFPLSADLTIRGADKISELGLFNIDVLYMGHTVEAKLWVVPKPEAEVDDGNPF